MSGQGFQFTPFGILPIGTGLDALPAEHVAGSALPTPVHATPYRLSEPARPATAPATAAQPMTGKQIRGLVQARIKAIDTRLREVPALQAERAQLAALLAASSPRKRARNNQH